MALYPHHEHSLPRALRANRNAGASSGERVLSADSQKQKEKGDISSFYLARLLLALSSSALNTLKAKTEMEPLRTTPPAPRTRTLAATPHALPAPHDA
eukprot:scaffold25579_cov124-Isochrysis_galbana.AAC.1